MGNQALPELEAFAGAHVLVVGDVMLDRFVYGGVKRISPEAPIPVMLVERELAMPGGAGNVARNIASLGARVRLIGLVGDDAAADELHEALSQPRIEPLLVVDETRPTAEKVRFIAGQQQLLRVDRERQGGPGADAAGTLAETVLQALDGVAAVVISDYAKGVVSDSLLAALIPAARQRGLPVLVDPKGEDYARYRGASLVTPNQKEAALAVGAPCDSDAEAEAAARQLMQECGIEAALITRGAQGMTLLAAADAAAALHLPAEAREVFDVSGAGDTVVAALAVALAAGLPLARAAQIANAAAGIVVAKVGTAVVLPEELRDALHLPDPLGLDGKVMHLAQARDAVARWRMRGQRIGFTNGCFDLLHAGHLALLAEARSKCDRLIVAINADSSVRQLKGPERPVQDEQHRARLLAALNLVDMVIVFAEETPVHLLQALRPDLLIKGGDYGIDQVVGADIVQAYGGEVQVSRLVQGHSTTATIKKMRS